MTVIIINIYLAFALPCCFSSPFKIFSGLFIVNIKSHDIEFIAKITNHGIYLKILDLKVSKFPIRIFVINLALSKYV